MTFTYRVSFTLASNNALVGMIFVADGLGTSYDESAVLPISKGTTTLTLIHTYAIPAGAKQVEVLIAMEAQDVIRQTSTTLKYQVQ